MPDRDENNSSHQSFDGQDFLRGFCSKYVRADGQTIVVELTPIEEAALGRFVIEAVVGFLLGLNFQSGVNGAQSLVSSSTHVESGTRSLT